jgi:hypothetical protein
MIRFLARSALDAAALAAFVFVLFVIVGAITVKSARGGDCHRHAIHTHCH